MVVKDRKCSTSYIQRKLGIGYNKAARLVEQMEEAGLVLDRQPCRQARRSSCRRTGTDQADQRHTGGDGCVIRVSPPFNRDENGIS